MIQAQFVIDAERYLALRVRDRRTISDVVWRRTRPLERDRDPEERRVET
jgi:hypothetical protein